MRAARTAALHTRARVAVLAALILASVGMPAAVAAADAPGTCTSATPARALNTWLSDTIASPTDVDWFKFTIPATTRAIVTLGALPADYDLRVYAGCSTLLASAARPGPQFEEIYRSFGPGTYFVRVSGFDGASSTVPYAVRFRTLAAGIRILSSTTWTDTSGRVHVAGEVLNNSAQPRRWIQIDATLLNASGGTVGRAVAYPDVPVLSPWSRSPFEVVTTAPTGFSRATLRVCTPSSTGSCRSGEVTSAPLPGLAVIAGTSYIDALGRRHYPGAVRNDNTNTARGIRSAVTAYDNLGNVRAVGSEPTSPDFLGTGATAAYDLTASGSSGFNRYVTVASGGLVGCAASPRYTGAQENLAPPLTRATAVNRVALTFDMGGRMTPATKILELLVANRVCATLFPTGAISRTTEGQAALAIVKAHPELFEVGNHTMNHCDLVRGGGGAPGATQAAYCQTLAPSPTESQVKAELTEAEGWIELYTGMQVQPFWRAPFGVSNVAVRTWAAEVGYTKQWKWDVDTIDWRPISDGGPTARDMTLKVVNNATSGSVVLMHLGGYQTLDALQSMIDGLRSRGFTLTTLSDMAH